MKVFGTAARTGHLKENGETSVIINEMEFIPLKTDYVLRR